jgi:hypothetical protein
MLGGGVTLHADTFLEEELCGTRFRRDRVIKMAARNRNYERKKITFTELPFIWLNNLTFFFKLALLRRDYPTIIFESTALHT